MCNKGLICDEFHYILECLTIEENRGEIVIGNIITDQIFSKVSQLFTLFEDFYVQNYLLRHKFINYLKIDLSKYGPMI